MYCSSTDKALKRQGEQTHNIVYLHWTESALDFVSGFNETNFGVTTFILHLQNITHVS